MTLCAIPRGREYNVTEVAEIINGRGYKISRGYISALRAGHKATPRQECVQALASFFDVPVAYFYDDDIHHWVEKELRNIAVLRHTPVREFSRQVHGLSADSLELLRSLITHLRKLEGLPESSEDPTPKRRRRLGERTDPQNEPS